MFVVFFHEYHCRQVPILSLFLWSADFPGGPCKQKSGLPTSSSAASGPLNMSPRERKRFTADKILV